MIDQVINSAPLFLLVFVRCVTLIWTLPLFSMRTVPRIAKIALSMYIAFFLMSSANYSAYDSWLFQNGETMNGGTISIYYFFLLVGEALIGIIIGFFVSMIFAAFSTAGQLFAFQMGFSAASAYDSLSQIENPLMGQYLNLLAMLFFLQSGWFQKLFLKGLRLSLENFNIFTLISQKDDILKFLLSGLTKLFADAFLIALPIIGVLVFITVCTGLLSKAAPQMNLLSEGFPIMILLTFFTLLMLLPLLIDFFEMSFNTGMTELVKMLQAGK